MNNEEDEIVIKTGSPKYPTVYRLTTYNGGRFFDIRKFYTKKDTSEIAPTPKGIMLNSESFSALAKVLNNRLEEVQDWLNHESEDKELSKKLAEQAEKVQDEQFKAKNFKGSSDKLNSNNFYTIKYDGDKRELIFNEDHHLFKNITDLSEEDKEIFSKIIMSFQQAADLFDDQKINSSEFIKHLIHNWSIVLNNYLD